MAICLEIAVNGVYIIPSSVISCDTKARNFYHENVIISSFRRCSGNTFCRFVVSVFFKTGLLNEGPPHFRRSCPELLSNHF